MVVQDEINIQESSINQKSNNTMSVMLCTTRATLVNKKSCLVARTVSFDTTDLHLLTFRILQPNQPNKDIELDVSHVISHSLMILLQYPPVKSYLNQCFQVSQLLKYDGNIVITQIFFKTMLWWKCGHLQIASYET